MDWTRREIVAQIPEDAASIHYGFFLQGDGEVEARGFRFEMVSDDIAETAGPGAFEP